MAFRAGGAKIGCGPINNLQQVFDDPHVQARGMVVNLDHPLAGEGGAAVIGGRAVHGSTRDLPPCAPDRGQHTEEVLREKLGLIDEDLATLRDKEVI